MTAKRYARHALVLTVAALFLAGCTGDPFVGPELQGADDLAAEQAAAKRGRRRCPRLNGELP